MTLEKKFEEYLKKQEEAGLKRKLREVYPVSARECIIDGIDGTCLDFASNNYLGIADHPYIKEESIRWTTRLGSGSKASRLVSGTFPEYSDLEKRIATWKGTEDALILGSGYMANIGLISALSDRKSVIVADKLNHASLNAGAQLSGAKFLRYAHNNLDDLRKKISIEKAKTASNSEREMIIVSDTVFSMDGDIADISELARIAKEENALLYLDDAHATGVFGEKGEGLAHSGTADIAMGTFSKAMGTYGAYVACSKVFKEYFVNRCGAFVYTTAPPPGIYGAISAALELVQSKEFCEIRRLLLEKSVKFASEIRRIGFDTGKTETPIIPVIIGDVEETLRISQELMDQKIFAVPIRPPTVPKGTARLRLSLNAAHTDEDIDRLLSALEKAKG